jgi:hypothetical protein
MEPLFPDPKEEYAFIHIPKNAGESMISEVGKIELIISCPHGIVFNNISHLKKIVIIRNPINRFTSAFFDHRKRNKHSEWLETPEQLVHGLISGDCLNWIKPTVNKHYVNGKHIETDWVFNPQIDWIIDPWRIMIFENIDHEITQLNKEIGTNIILPKINTGIKKPFRYTETSLDFLQDYYSQDLKFYQDTLQARGLSYVI